jgi:hypothetical protein
LEGGEMKMGILVLRMMTTNSPVYLEESYNCKFHFNNIKNMDNYLAKGNDFMGQASK